MGECGEKERVGRERVSRARDGVSGVRERGLSGWGERDRRVSEWGKRGGVSEWQERGVSEWGEKGKKVGREK